MHDLEAGTLIDAAVDSVLETMFFSTTNGPAEPEIDGDFLEARLGFHGCPSGTLDVRLSKPSARILAASFLGEEEETLSDAQPGEVLCELSNMLCGALVSSLEGEQVFDLALPLLVNSGDEAHSDEPVHGCASKSFALEGGILTVSLQLQTTS